MIRGLGTSLLLVSTLALAAGSAGCASARCAEGAAALTAAAPAGMRAWQTDASDGVCLQSFAWKAAGDVKGVVVIAHGLRDHATRYEDLARALTAHGFAVYAEDMRGHGFSGGAHQRFDSMDQLVNDLDDLVQAARLEHPGKPVFIYGHSLGGLLTSHYALRFQKDLAGVVLSGAALKLMPDVTSGQISAARFFGTVLPGLPAQELDDGQFVSTPAARDALLNDPLVDHSNLPARSAKVTVDAIDAAAARLEDFTVPLLVMHGEADKTTNVEGSRALVTRARSQDKALRIWEGQLHDLLHEPRAKEVIDAVVRWIEAHATPAAPAR